MKKLLLFFILLPLISSAQWTQVGANIDAEFAQDAFGSSVSFSADGNVLAVGAKLNNGTATQAGHVRVFQNNSGSWVQIGQDIDGESVGDQFGTSVSLSGDGTILAIGGPLNDGNGANAGHVRVFQYNGTNWLQLGSDIDGEFSGDNFGFSISLSSDATFLSVGAPYNDGNGTDSGHVRSYQYIANIWQQIGSDINGDVAGDSLGWSVALSGEGDTLVVGAPFNDNGGSNIGQVKVYSFNGVWSQVGNSLQGDTPGDVMGRNVDVNIDGTTITTGLIGSDVNGNNSGKAKVFENISNVWQQKGLDIDGFFANDFFGSGISINEGGNVIAIGSRLNDENGTNSGQTRIFQFLSSSWQQVGQNINGESSGDEFSTAIDLNSTGTLVAIGAQLNDGAGSNAGHVRVFENPTLSVLDFPINISLSLYPNPTRGGFSIDSNDAINSVSVFDINGKLIKSFLEDYSIYYIDELSDGVYFIKINLQKESTTKRLIKK